MAKDWPHRMRERGRTPVLAERPFPMGSTLAKEPGAPSASIRTSHSLSTARSGLSLGAQGPQPYLPRKQQTLQSELSSTAQHGEPSPLGSPEERVGGRGGPQDPASPCDPKTPPGAQGRV